MTYGRVKNREISIIMEDAKIVLMLMDIQGMMISSVKHVIILFVQKYMIVKILRVRSRKMNKDLINILLDAYEKEYGEDVKFSEGDVQIFELNDCMIILSLEDRILKTQIIGDKPIKVDYETGFFQN